AGGWIIELRGYTYHKDGLNFLRKTLVKNLQKFDQYAQTTGQDLPVHQLIPGGSDPINGKVSHVCLLAFDAVTNPARDHFKTINHSLVSQLLLPAAAGGMGMGPEGAAGMGSPAGMPAGMPPAAGGPMGAGGPGGPEGMGAPVQKTRTPLLASDRVTTMNAGGFPEGSPMFTPPPGGPAGPGGPGGSQPTTGPRMPKPKTRYEFVVSFIWKEPLPSEGTGGADGATGSATPAPGMPGMPGI
ncbi:MAG: hypothetical protein LC104_16725, partial [Bacteroidales bacterium]|nr:hypothetical protein [Bacteroidales bacterium]